MDENKLSSISQADTDEKISEFWDTHDFTDFDTDAPDVEFEIICAVPIDVKLFHAIEEQAHKRGVRVETLVNPMVAGETRGGGAVGGSQLVKSDLSVKTKGARHHWRALVFVVPPWGFEPQFWP